MLLPLPPSERTEVDKASMPDAPAVLPTAWKDSYTRRSLRPATIPAESQAVPVPFDNDVWNASRRSHSQSSSGQYDQQQQPLYQAYHPRFRTVDYQQRPSHQQQKQEQALPWPISPPRTLQIRPEFSRTLEPTMAPAVLDSVTDLATQRLSLSKDVLTGEGGKIPPAVAMVVVMNPSGEGRALQTHHGNTLDGYNIE
ncbi:hypothetical protein PG997_003293 [Apiospora hydei]|uniref:Uncharacterized protein n=1 Tax=Apiospora hydei TaxID=1337664 RepID=A0ABR1WYW0_9PEZI